MHHGAPTPSAAAAEANATPPQTAEGPQRTSEANPLPYTSWFGAGFGGALPHMGAPPQNASMDELRAYGRQNPDTMWGMAYRMHHGGPAADTSSSPPRSAAPPSVAGSGSNSKL